MHKILAVAASAVIALVATTSSARAAGTHLGTLSYERVGRGATTLVLVPGLSSGAEVWKDVVADLRDRYSIVTVTFDGFDGAPSATHHASLDDDVASLHDLVAREKLVAPVFVGHSLGGFLCLRLAAEHPTDTGKVVAVDALPIFPPPQPGDTATSRAAAAHAFAQQIRTADDATYAAQARGAASFLTTAPASVAFVTGMAMRSDRAVVADRAEAMTAADLRPELPRITAPVLVLAAAAAFGADMTKTLYASLYAGTPHVQVEPIADARHFIMLDDKAAFERALQTFAPAT